MSLNKFTNASYTEPKPWMDIRCNVLSFGDSAGRINTQAYAPTYTTTVGTITSQSAIYFTSDHTSLRLRGHVNLSTSATSHNSFALTLNLPPEAIARFGTGSAVIATGNVCEYPTNSNTNNGQIAYGVLNATNDGVNLQVFWNNGNVSSVFGARVYIDCCLFKP